MSNTVLLTCKKASEIHLPFYYRKKKKKLILLP